SQGGALFVQDPRQQALVGAELRQFLGRHGEGRERKPGLEDRSRHVPRRIGEFARGKPVDEDEHVHVGAFVGLPSSERSEEAELAFWTANPELRVTSVFGGRVGDVAVTPEAAVGSALTSFASEESQLVVAHRRALRGERVAYEVGRGERRYEVVVGPARGGAN